MTVPYRTPGQLAEHTGDYEAAGLNAPPQPKAHFPRWLSDMRPLHAAILMVAIWAVTFLVIIFRHGG